MDEVVMAIVSSTRRTTECVLVWPHGSPHTSGRLIVNIQRFEISAAVTLFRVDWITLSTPHTSGQSDKIIIRAVKNLGHF